MANNQNDTKTDHDQPGQTGQQESANQGESNKQQYDSNQEISDPDLKNRANTGNTGMQSEQSGNSQNNFGQGSSVSGQTGQHNQSTYTGQDASNLSGRESGNASGEVLGTTEENSKSPEESDNTDKTIRDQIAAHSEQNGTGNEKTDQESQRGNDHKSNSDSPNARLNEEQGDLSV